MRIARAHATDPVKLLREAIRNVNAIDPATRPRTSDGRPGGLIEFPRTEKREFIVIGDLHANTRNLNAILKDCANIEKVRQDKAVLEQLQHEKSSRCREAPQPAGCIAREYRS